MADEDGRTIKEKLLFYTTAFFILLGTFSLFAFLFLVPFVIDPAFTTIYMHFDTRPALCITVDTVANRGVSNCSWSSCREGCTKELFECIQIQVNYRAQPNETENTTVVLVSGGGGAEEQREHLHKRHKRELHQIRFNDVDEDDEDEERGTENGRHVKRRAIRDYNYDDSESFYEDSSSSSSSTLSQFQSGNALAHKEPLNYEYVDGGDGAGDYVNGSRVRASFRT